MIEKRNPPQSHPLHDSLNETEQPASSAPGLPREPSLTDFYRDFLKTFARLYPQTALKENLESRISPQLICPQVMSFPRVWLAQAEGVVKAFSHLRELPEWKMRLANLEPAIPNPHHHSVLMSYDFHVDENNQLRLIEINTNASMALIADTSYQTFGIANGLTADFRKEILEAFLEDFLEFSMQPSKKMQPLEPSKGKPSLSPGPEKPQNIAIIDDHPSEQRLYIEFEMYRELFEQNHLSARIVDPAELNFTDGALWFKREKIDLVYNRDTDFHLVEERSQALKSARDAGVVCVTPSAYEYHLLADKERLEELSQLSTIVNLALSVSEKAILSRTLIRTRSIAEFTDTAALWSDRKKYFFKPRRSFGGKAVYRGSSVSRGTFQKILAGDYLVQDFVPPLTTQIEVHTPAGTEIQEFKFDLRFYVYRDRIQLSCARLYQGQMTNSQTPGGGVAVIDWVP